jgi:hypothetical protein
LLLGCKLISQMASSSARAVNTTSLVDRPRAPNDALKKLILTEASPMKPDPTPKVTKSDEEWKKLLRA